MFKYVWLICVSVVLSACVFQTQTQKPPLLVDKITTDNDNESLIKQINIKFNQDIAIVGAIPTQAQIDSIIMSHELNKQCQWRFIQLNILSCDLKARLKFMTDYHITVNATFSAFGQLLSQKFDDLISTPVPNLSVRLKYNNDSFPDSGFINYFKNIDISASMLERNLMLKSPAGKNYPVTVVRKKEADGYNRDEYKITVKNLPTLKEDGRYKFVLPAGFQASKKQRVLAKERVIDSFRYSNQLTFYGFVCGSYSSLTKHQSIIIDEQGVLPCEPESIKFVFSSRFDQLKDSLSNNSSSWLVGHDVEYIGTRERNGEAFVSLALIGDSKYTLDLTKLTNDQGNISNPQVLTFKTKPATPLWKISERDKTVIESQFWSLPQLVRRNVGSLTQETIAINNSQQLLFYLNNSKSLTPISKVLSESPQAKITFSEQPIEFRKVLDNLSGLAHIKLTGSSSKPFRQGAGLEIKSESFIANAAAFNMAVWHQRDLIVQLIDWDGVFVEGVNVSLVCESQQVPLILGVTQSNGMLWIKDKAWQTIYSDLRQDKHECWLWADKTGLTSAITLPPVTLALNDSIRAMAWTTQPLYQRGDLVELGFIARQRTQQGLLPLLSLENYRLEIIRSDKKRVPVLLSKPSKMGFSNASFQLTKDMPQGSYIFNLVNITNDSNDYIGRFIVTTFTAPEFEHDLTVPKTMFIDRPIIVSAKANRMNGAPLVNAKANIRFSIGREYGRIKGWPEGYEFDSREDVDNNKNNLEKGRILNKALDKNGELTVSLQDYQSTIPYGEITISSEIVAEDGSTQTSKMDRPYFSRKHFIGTLYNHEKQQLEVIAIDYQGNEIKNINTTVNITSSDRDEKIPVKEIAYCELNTLPGYCQVSTKEKVLDVNIVSGNENYQWQRSIENNQNKDIDVDVLKKRIQLTLNNKKIVAGEKFNVTLTSPFSGVATLIINGDNVKKTWQQSVRKGRNVVSLTAKESWLPSIRLFAALSVSRDTANAVIAQQLAQLKNTNSDSTDQSSLDSQILSLGSQRLLTDDIVIALSSRKAMPHIKLFGTQGAVLAGQSINVRVSADQDAQTQLWLVNDALLALRDKEVADYDFDDILNSLFYDINNMKYAALSDHLVSDALLGLKSLWEFKSVTSMRFKPKGGMHFDIEGVEVSSGSETRQRLLSNSRMLTLLDLKANKSQNILVQLPQLIGRWKLIALTATEQTATIDAIDITTTRPVEYFIDAPSHMYTSDVAQLAITAINQSDKPLNDTLTLINGNSTLKTIDVNLKPNQQKRLMVTLPTLAIGQNLLRLTSEMDSNYVNYHDINVNESTLVNQQQWLIKNGHSELVASPQGALEGSIKLSYKSLNNNVPDWQALTFYNKGYQHQCWEQNLSRALSFSVNPQASKVWPQGLQALQTTLQQTNEDTHFAYFEYTRSDMFLTAYTYLVDGWLDRQQFKIRINEKKIKSVLKFILDHNESYYSVTNTDRSMALLALAIQGDITLDEALVYRQKIGLADSFSNVLQALALKVLGAKKELYQVQLMEFNDTIYQDDSTNIFSQTSHQCFAALVYDEGSVEREELTARVIAKQQQLGHFGSTFANGVCSYLLRDKRTQNLVGSQSLAYQESKGSLSYIIKDNPAHWLTMNYKQSLIDVTAQNNGLSIKRERLVRVNDKWEVITSSTVLHVGDIVKTKLSVSSAIDREHIAVTDDVAGGLEVISPHLENVFYKDDRDYLWFNGNHVEITDGKVQWYIINLARGEQEYAYFSRVRHVGQFITGPARAEAMYRSDINARTASSEITID